MENKIDLEAVRRLSTETKFSPGLLEKDYHLTRILHKIAEKQIKDLVFKGGTCLNKCYLGFYRLSEDLDFVYNKDTKSLSKTQIKRMLDKLRRDLFEIVKNHGSKTHGMLLVPFCKWFLITVRIPRAIIMYQLLVKDEWNSEV